MKYKVVITTEEQYQKRSTRYVGNEETGTDNPYVAEETTEFRDIQVYQQTVEDLDLVEVIKAVNKIKPETAE